MGRVYEQICRRWRIDDGEPSPYEVALVFEPTVEYRYYLDYGDQFSIVARAVNSLTLATGRTPGVCRVISSRDGFRTADGTELTFYDGGQNNMLSMGRPTQTIDEGVVKLATDLWTGLLSMEKGRARIWDALTFYYQAWNAHYMEHICINLATCLELLFAPHSHGETTHQLSFAVARFLGGSRTEVEQAYDDCRAFYGLRSAILHGGQPDQGKLIAGTIAAFTRATEVLRRVVLDPATRGRFANEETRRRFLRALLFGEGP